MSTDGTAAPIWECMGRKQSLPEPGECNWPDCGCDPHATKVIESLLEQGWRAPSAPTEREPVAWAVFTANGNIRMWSTINADVKAFAASHRLFCEPLYRAFPAAKATGREHLTIESMEADFNEWRKTLTVVDRPSNLEIFSQGCVAGWNAKEASGDARVEECADIALAIDSGRGNEKEIAKAIRALATGAKP